MFASVLIANRGEIARRITRTLRRLGIRAVVVHTDADADAPFAREADVALAIGDYLDVEAVVAAAVESGAEALHPGYGFLSENPALARACAAAGIAWVGPPPEAMELMADKVRAKAAARAAGVPVVPGWEDPSAAPADAYPLMIKAAAGGGGRGMRVVASPGELEAAVAAARREALAGFGDDTVFAERLVQTARHLEVQVLADAHGGVLHLGERECSLQRRHQKVVEEAPSPAVDSVLRETLGREAVALARAAGYVGAGTVEFIADAADPAEHFFLECNARLQVEHPVTELVTGLDLVELQLRVAAGEPLPFSQGDVVVRGHAIEARVNAEDPARGFLPGSGDVLAYRRPSGPGVRVDDAIEPGARVGTDYDALVAKVIVHGEDRGVALRRLDAALAATAICGLVTNAGFVRRLLAVPEVLAGRLDTALLERLDGLGEGAIPAAEVAEAAALVLDARDREAAGDDPATWCDGWRLGGVRVGSLRRLAVDGGEPRDVRTAHLAPAQGGSRCSGPGRNSGTHPAEGGQAWRIGARNWLTATDADDTLWLSAEGETHRLRAGDAASAAAGAAASGELRAPMPGQVILVPGEAGATVRAGDPLVVLESMKMELTVAAPFDGVVEALSVAPGDTVALDESLGSVSAS